MTYSLLSTALAACIALQALITATSLRVTINGKNTGTLQCNSILHKPIKLPVWPVWSGVVAQCFDWIKAPQISESIISNIGGRVVPITLSNLDVSPFLLLAHHCHSFTPLDPIRWQEHLWFLLQSHLFKWRTFHLCSFSMRDTQRAYKTRPSWGIPSTSTFRLWHSDLLHRGWATTPRFWRCSFQPTHYFWKLIVSSILLSEYCGATTIHIYEQKICILSGSITLLWTS